LVFTTAAHEEERMRRVFAVALVAVLSLILFVPAAVGAGSGPRLPHSAADWAGFTQTEQAAALAYERQLLDVGLRDGSVRTERFMSPTQTTIVSAGAASTRSTVSTGPASTLSLTISAACGFTVHFVTGGRWVGGGGYTDTNNYVYHIYASRPGKLGQLFRDGQLNKNWQQELYNTTHAENWSDQDFSWSWEHPTYVVKGWHGVQQTSGGSYQLGPDAYCTHSYTP
jgi:hypothetical protein